MINVQSIRFMNKILLKQQNKNILDKKKMLSEIFDFFRIRYKPTCSSNVIKKKFKQINLRSILATFSLSFSIFTQVIQKCSWCQNLITANNNFPFFIHCSHFISSANF